MTRLGNVGIDFGAGGRITVGKQWAVHTDVTLYTTDQFTVFGSQASATYTAGTDGGFLATGRADQVVTYRNTIFKVLRIGGQAQFKIGRDQRDARRRRRLGTADDPARRSHRRRLHEDRFAEDTKAAIRGLDDDAEFMAARGADQLESRRGRRGLRRRRKTATS